MKMHKVVVFCLLVMTTILALSSLSYAADNDPSIRIEQVDGDGGSYKLVVTATASAAIGSIVTASIALSYDNTVIAPVYAGSNTIITDEEIFSSFGGYENADDHPSFKPFTTKITNGFFARPMWVAAGSRTIFDVTALSISPRNMSAGVEVIEFHFKLRDGKTIDDMNSSTFALTIGPTIGIGSATLGSADAIMYCLGYTGKFNGDNKELFLTSFTFANSDKQAAHAETPRIISQPTDKLVFLDYAAELSVTAFVARGTLSYQWYSNTTKSNNGGTAISGAIDAIYNAPTDEVGISYYYCAVTNTDNNVTGNKTATVFSNVVSVKVSDDLTNAATPVITQQPESLTVNLGDPVTLSVKAEVSKGYLSYQWYLYTSEGIELNPITGAIFETLPALNREGTFIYCCIITNTDLTATGIKTVSVKSDYASITMIPRVDAETPVITVQPIDCTVYVGETVMLWVAASVSSGTLSYQWYSNTTNSNGGGAAISGATSAVYYAPTDDVGTSYYYCAVTNTDNEVVGNKTVTVISNAVSVSVMTDPNAARPVITKQPESITVDQGEMISLAVEATVSKGVLSYQWYMSSVPPHLSYAIPDATNVAYNPPTDVLGARYYFCVVTNTDDDAIGYKTTAISSNGVIVTVIDPDTTHYLVTYNVVDGYGTLEATIPTGSMVLPGTSIRFTARPGDGYYMKVLKNNGTVVNSTTTDYGAEIYDCEINGTTNVTVEFESERWHWPPFVPVTDITNVPNTAIAGAPLALTGTVLPYAASNYNILWSVKSAGATDASINDSILSTMAAGTVVVTATIENGLAIGTDYKKDFTITVKLKDDINNAPPFVPVTDIINVPNTAIAGTPLTLTSTVLPYEASYNTIEWSLKSAGATGATISNNILNTTAAGTVVVTATINNGLVFGTAFSKDYTISVHDYGIYLTPEKTTLKAGDTFYVDVMLVGNKNYTQMAAEIIYDTNLLEFKGYDNLQGWAASVTKSATDKVAVRSVPSMNMVLGASCSPAVRIVRLAFTVKDGFVGDTIGTELSFTSTLVSPVGGVVGTTVDPGTPLSLTLQK